MCGICGIFNPSGLDGDDRFSISPMTDAIAHRGPDESAVRVENDIALGHTRLSIVDVEGGAQPMSNEDGSVWTVFNGEIYNFLTLRGDLIQKGHKFATRADTEVLVHGYEEYGTELIPKLDGMFAFAIWDSQRRRLILARDRVGKKPLYYSLSAGRLFFASEIKSILLHRRVGRCLEPESLHNMISFQHVPGENTMFRGIKKLRPAHYIVFDEKKDIRQKRYWFPEQIETAGAGAADGIIASITGALGESVKARLMGDVPVGAFLSGGVDSSAVAALMSGCAPGKVSTFSIGFDRPEYDETSFARIVANKFGTNHHEFSVTSAELMSSVSRILWHCDEPVADSSILPTYYLSRLTREHVKVALSGDGGDELFGGYERYIADKYMHALSAIPAPVRKRLLAPVFAMISSIAPVSKIKHRADQLSRFTSMSDPERHLNWLSFFNGNEKSSLYTKEFAALAAAHPSYELMDSFYLDAAGGGRDFTARQLLVDFLTYLPETLMMKVDRASMANGLEVRCPILDRRVVEIAMSLPGDIRIKGNVTKWALKQSLRGLLPDEIIDRRKKGFEVPLDAWFRDPLRDALNDFLTDSTAASRGIFNQSEVKKLLKEHQDGASKHGHKLWSLLSVELWHRLFIDGDAPSSPRTFF